jgi:SAM-dependent methyltransferase
VVCAFQVLEHVPDPRAFLASCVYCLKPGGRLILSVPAEDSFTGLVPNNCLNLPPHHLTRWSDKALLALREEFNLHDLQLIPLPLEDIHHEHYCNSIAGYEACRKLDLDHTLVGIDIWSKVCELKTALLPSVKKRFAENLPDIRGHDVLAIGIK